MAIVVEYKYTPDQMPVDELKRTFAARQGLLDRLLSHLRQQAQAKSLSSFLLVGPRGSGKTTLVLMLCQCIREDPELAAAWLPLRFREEQFELCSLRDLLAAAVRSLAEEEVAGAAGWLSRVEQAAQDEESQSLAMAALRDIARSQGKRLVLFVENVNLLLGRALDEAGQATLRRLLMVDPFLMLVGTAVQMFEEVEGYEQALFNYFHPLFLEKLDDGQMSELLARRAEYDGNTAFLEKLEEHRPKLRAVARLTGGNPRFLLMVYEILSEGGVTSAVQVLQRLVDQLTPMLKHVLEGLPPQQAKILDALMRAGGTATPAALAQATRLKLNVVTAQLRRLKDNRMVEVLGGGKGQTAYYTVPDQLFCTWYQMRYLRQKRRRIELFVEVIRLWFEAEERLDHLRRLAGRAVGDSGGAARSLAEAAEYFAAALEGTPHQDAAKGLMVQAWLRAGEVVEAALALAELSPKRDGGGKLSGVSEIMDFSFWCRGHNMLPEATDKARNVAEERPDDLQAQLAYAFCAGAANEHRLLRDQLSRCLALPIPQPEVTRSLVMWRAVASLKLRDRAAAMEGLVQGYKLVPGEQLSPAAARMLQAVLEWVLGDFAGAVADCLELIESGELGPKSSAATLACRALARLGLNDEMGARADFAEALAKGGFSAEEWHALFVKVLQLAFLVGGVEATGRLVDQYVRVIGMAPREWQVEATVKICKLAAKPEARAFWPLTVRRMHEKLPAETAAAVAFLLPVADVLEGKPLAVLDALPPQERAFALEVLERFKPKANEPNQTIAEKP